MMQMYLSESIPLLPTQQEMNEIGCDVERLEQILAEAREHMDEQDITDPWLIEIAA